jgi:hypothetical protein
MGRGSIITCEGAVKGGSIKGVKSNYSKKQAGKTK